MLGKARLKVFFTKFGLPINGRFGARTYPELLKSAIYFLAWKKFAWSTAVVILPLDWHNVILCYVRVGNITNFDAVSDCIIMSLKQVHDRLISNVVCHDRIFMISTHILIKITPQFTSKMWFSSPKMCVVINQLCAWLFIIYKKFPDVWQLNNCHSPLPPGVDFINKFWHLTHHFLGV